MDIQDTTNAPRLDSNEIADRVLRLIDSIHDRDGLSPDNIQRSTGITVSFDPEDSDRYGFHGRVDDTWLYDLGSVVDQVAGGVRGLQFFFAAPGNPEADPTPVCTPDMDVYRRRLEGMGFTATPVRGDLEQLRYWEFVRKNVRVRATALTGSMNSCVRLITIDA
jgi:hypothetical protein